MDDGFSSFILSKIAPAVNFLIELISENFRYLNLRNLFLSVLLGWRAAVV